MEDEIHAYWRQRLAQEVEGRDELLAQLRSEVERLQHRCQELATINSMGRAAVATDVRDFAVGSAMPTPTGVMAVPLHGMVDFLHEYSNGLVERLPRESKRGRDDFEAATQQRHMHHQGMQRGDHQQQQQHQASLVWHQHQPPMQPVTPTVQQLLAQRQAAAGAPPPMAPLPQQATTLPVAVDESPMPSGPPAAAVAAGDAFDDDADDGGAVAHHGAAFVRQPSCSQQHLQSSFTDAAADGGQLVSVPANGPLVPFNMTAAAADRKRRERGPATEGEAIQLRPWLFSRDC